MNDSNESRDIYQLTSNSFDIFAVFQQFLVELYLESLSTDTVVSVILDLAYPASKQKIDMFEHMTGKCKLLGMERNHPPDTSYLSLMFVIRCR